ncbi:MAG: kelch repeat-containing protein, partial [Kangiellaceae bacterium]|nr:kelch repeat-containing protein [Kangiellaceae bacterium]
MYGGSDGDKAIDELWSYDPNFDTWSLVRAKGFKPTARFGHASTTLGNNLVIWGGKNEANIFAEMYFYNTLTNTWELITSPSEVQPAPGEGACL